MALILVVDDEPVVVQVACGALEPVGHTVVTASSSAQAYQAAAQMERIDVLIVNHKIPPERGRDIAERILLTHPEAKVMHVSGWLKGKCQD